VRERNSATLQQVTVLRKRSVTQVISDLLLKRVRLADEQVRASAEINERADDREAKRDIIAALVAGMRVETRVRATASERW